MSSQIEFLFFGNDMPFVFLFSDAVLTRYHMDQQPAQALTSTLSVPTRCDGRSNDASEANDESKIVAGNCTEQDLLRHDIKIEPVFRVYPPKSA